MPWTGVNQALEFLAWLPASSYGWPAAIGLLFMFAGLVLGFIHRRAEWRRQAEMLQATFDHASDGLLLLDARLHVEEANAAAERTLGRTRRRRREAFVYLLESGGVDLPELRDELDEGGLVQRSVALSDDDGARRLEVEAQTVHVDGQRRVAVTLRDVTERDRARLMIERFNRQVLDALPVRVVVMTPSGEYLYANRRVAPGREAREWLRGKNDFDYCRELGLHPEIALRRRSHRKRVLTERKRVQFEEVLQMPDGTLNQFARYYAPVFDLDGEITAVVGCGIDVTERRLHQQRRQELEEERTHLERFKQTLLDNVNHELRTPLAGIVGSARVLQQEVDGSASDFAGMIVDNARRLTDTLDALVELAVLRSEEQAAQPELLPLAAAVEHVVEDLQSVAETNELFLRFNPSVHDPLLRLDRECLERVLHSLIGNAVKFTESGGVLVEIDVDEDNVHIRVMDTGVGIDNGFLPHLFDAFHQESAGATRDFEGIGLGLTVVRRLLDLLNGTVTVESEKGQGSMFTITFPHAFPNALAPHNRRPRALLIMANEEVRQPINHLLAPFVHVSTADAVAQLDDMYSESFDVVLVDVDLNVDETPADLVRQIRRHDPFGTLPIVALDVHHRPGGPERFVEAGFDAHVDQPYDRIVLLDALSGVLETEGKNP